MAWNRAWQDYIPDGGANAAIKAWHENQPEREQDVASPSTLTDCPRLVWLRYKHKVPPLIPMGWGIQQRMLLGRIFENQIAEQYRTANKLLWHWKDDFVGESDKFTMGEGLSRVEGTPDLLLKYDRVLISDSKTSRRDSFGYIPLTIDGLWDDPLWNKHKKQVEAYYLLCHKNKDWFKKGYLDNGVTRREVFENGLPLPEACHLFSYALDDGIVRREFEWDMTKQAAEDVLRFAKRWNTARQAETMPECTCEKEGTIKFCYYVSKQETTKKGGKIGVECCPDSLGEGL